MHEARAEYLERMGEHEPAKRERAAAEEGWLKMLANGTPPEVVEHLQAEARRMGADHARRRMEAAARRLAKQRATAKRRAFRKGRRPKPVEPYRPGTLLPEYAGLFNAASDEG
jgi:hypothetical protein